MEKNKTLAFQISSSRLHAHLQDPFDPLKKKPQLTTRYFNVIVNA